MNDYFDVNRLNIVHFTHGSTDPLQACRPGVGVVLSADTHYRMESQAGAILIVVEAECLQATESGKSTPERVLGQLWPGEDLDKPKPRTLISISKRLWYLWRFRKLRRAIRLDRSGWAPMPVEVGPVRKFLLGLGLGR